MPKTKFQNVIFTIIMAVIMTLNKVTGKEKKKKEA